MTGIICVTSPRPVGCTFLEWSLYHLSGQQQYFHADQHEWAPLVADPLNTGAVANAHAHKKNHPMGLDATKNCINALQSQHTDRLRSFYPYALDTDVALAKLNIAVDQLNNTEVQDQVNQYLIDEYVSTVNHCLNQQIPVIYVHTDSAVIGYFWHTRTLDRMMLSNDVPNSLEEKHQEFQQTFFSNSLASWQAQGLTEIWDQRERMALDMRPFNIKHLWHIGFAQPHVHINCQDLWSNTEDVIVDTMRLLKIKTQSSQLQSWQHINKKWQHIQYSNLKFYRELDHIVTSVVQGWHYELSTLELWQEAIIQHCLIYKHNLNLKTWQLSNFPTNTKDLHCLLEENIHQVNKIY